MKWVVHFARCGNRKEIDDVLFKLHRHRSKVLGGTDVADHDENLVLIDQLLRRQNRFFGVIAVVLDQQFELAPSDAALFVDLINAPVACPARDCLP
jgi:hypothetical protein